jgi:hypothetical protein
MLILCKRPGPKVSCSVQGPDNLLICDNCVAASVDTVAKMVAAGATVKSTIFFLYGTLKVPKQLDSVAGYGK